MQQTDYLSNNQYKYWSQPSTNQYYVSKGNDQSKLAGPFSSVDQIPSNIPDSDFKSQNISDLTEVNSAQTSQSKVGSETSR